MDASEVSGTLRPTLFSLSAGRTGQEGLTGHWGLTGGAAAPRRQVNDTGEREEQPSLSPLPQ